MTEETLYERLGGRDAIEAVVDRFYQRVLSDDGLVEFFEDADVDALHAHQAAFLTYVTGGANEYEGQSMREAHAGLGITEEDFEAVAEHLQATLDEFDVPEPETEEVMNAVAGLQDQVVTA